MQCTQRSVLSLGLKNLRRSFHNNVRNTTGAGGGGTLVREITPTSPVFQKVQLPNVNWQGSVNFSRQQHAPFSTTSPAAATPASATKEEALPKLPVPPLNDTLAKYLR